MDYPEKCHKCGGKLRIGRWGCHRIGYDVEIWCPPCKDVTRGHHFSNLDIAEERAKKAYFRKVLETPDAGDPS